RKRLASPTNEDELLTNFRFHLPAIPRPRHGIPLSARPTVPVGFDVFYGCRLRVDPADFFQRDFLLGPPHVQPQYLKLGVRPDLGDLPCKDLAARGQVLPQGMAAGESRLALLNL